MWQKNRVSGPDLILITVGLGGQIIYIHSVTNEIPCLRWNNDWIRRVYSSIAPASWTALDGVHHDGPCPVRTD